MFGRRSLALALVLAMFGLRAAAVEPSDEEMNTARRWAQTWFGLQNPGAVPFSLDYGGKPIGPRLAAWPCEATTETLDDGRLKRTLAWTDPDTGLRLACTATVYRDFPALEWLLTLRNTGPADTPILERIQPLDADFPSASPGDFTLFHNGGTDAKLTDYEPFETVLGANTERRFVSYGGRPTDRVLPLFNLAGPDAGGTVLAIGWTGQWAARFGRGTAPSVRVTAGMEITHLRLHPGEEIRSPAILAVFWSGEDRLRGHNLLRRLLLAHATPAPAGRASPPPIAASVHGFIPFEGTSESNLLECVAALAAHRTAIDTLWVDAGWFACPDKPNAWAWAVGEIDPDPVRFPRGFKPVAEAAHAAGLRLLLWFEPERAMPGTWLYEHHPEWLLAPADLPPERAYQADWRMLDLGHPDALAWAKTHYAQFLRENGIDIYRQDCNLHPVFYWRGGEPADRQGIREIRHVTGLYDFLDTLVREVPGLTLDVCAGTGSRNDLEILRRALNLTRSDGAWWDSIADQSKTFGYAFWTPVTGIGSTSPDPYAFRSGMGAHVSLPFDLVHATSEEWDRWTAQIAQYAALRETFTGDYYPLTDYSVAPDAWMAWQFHCPDQDAGLVQAFRRPDAPAETACYRLHGLNPQSAYCVTDLDAAPADWQRRTGRELMEHGVEIRLPHRPASAVIVYRRLPADTP